MYNKNHVVLGIVQFPISKFYLLVLEFRWVIENYLNYMTCGILKRFFI